jgi:predicted phosphodiesterase
MKVALFSDIHGNITGLRAVLSQVERIGGVEKILCAGDILGGGAGTEDLLDLLWKYRVEVVRGNHEEMALDIESSKQFLAAGEWDKWAFEYEWLHEQIGQKYWDWMAALPMYRTVELGEGKRLTVCHATMESTWEKVCAADVSRDKLERAYGEIEANIIAYGHYHNHHVMWVGEKLLVNVASVGLRGDGMSAFTIVKVDGGKMVVQQYQVKYNVKEEERIALMKGFPEEKEKKR